MIACNWELLNRVDYNKSGIVKSVLFRYDSLMNMAVSAGDQVAMIVCIEVKQAVHARGVLTFKQRRYLGLWWRGFDYVEIGTMFRKSPVTVKLTVDLACRRISNFLCKKYSFDPLSVAKYRGIKNDR